MTVEIKMKGEFDAIEVEGDFHDAVKALELEGAKGASFVVFENLLGRRTAVRLSNITSVTDAA